MKARLVSDHRLCRMQPGDVKRLPREGAPLGFYVRCPVCGRMNVVLAEGQHVEEAAGELRALAPGFECEGASCAKHVHVKDGEFVVTDVHG